MPATRSGLSAPIIALIAFSLYVGAYCVMMRPAVVRTTFGGPLYVAPLYGSAGSRTDYLLTRLFLPVHVVDRAIRPDFWKP